MSPGQRGRGRSGQSAIARRCSFCGGPWHIQLSNCPAKNNVCELCSKRGHLAVACRPDRSARPRVTDPPRPGSVPASGSTQERRPSYHRWSQGDHLQGIIVADVTARDSSESRRAPEIKIPVVHRNGSGVLSSIPDTGAESTVIGPDLVETIGGNLHNLAPTNHTLFSADGTELRCLGTIQAVLRLGPSEVNTPIFVVDGVRSALLSWFHARDLGILPACFPQPTLLPQDIKHHQETEVASSLPETTDDCMTPAPEAVAHRHTDVNRVNGGSRPTTRDELQERLPHSHRTAACHEGSDHRVHPGGIDGGGTDSSDGPPQATATSPATRAVTVGSCPSDAPVAPSSTHGTVRSATMRPERTINPLTVPHSGATQRKNQ